jgi:hypothetical protein
MAMRSPLQLLGVANGKTPITPGAQGLAAFSINAPPQESGGVQLASPFVRAGGFSKWNGSVNTSRLFMRNPNYAVFNQQSPDCFPKDPLHLSPKDRAKLPVVFQKESCHDSCWKPKGCILDGRKA